MPDPEDEFKFSKAGKGWLRYFGLAVDEPRAVGANGLTDAQRMARAKDILQNRQFLDWIFNSGTKGHFEEVRPAPTIELPLVSVVENPSAIWRPTLENVVEWREFAKFIESKVQARIANQTSPAKVKEIINEAIKSELKYPTTDAGRKLHDALKSETGIDPVDLFRPNRYFRRLWASVEGRRALMDAGVILAAAIVAASAKASAEEAHKKAEEDLLAQAASVEAYAADHPDEGLLVVRVFEVRHVVDEAAPTTTYRYTALAWGKKEHLALWSYQNRSSLSAALPDALSTEYQEFLWIPPANERGPVAVPVTPDL